MYITLKSQCSAYITVVKSPISSSWLRRTDSYPKLMSLQGMGQQATLLIWIIGEGAQDSISGVMGPNRSIYQGLGHSLRQYLRKRLQRLAKILVVKWDLSFSKSGVSHLVITKELSIKQLNQFKSQILQIKYLSKWDFLSRMTQLSGIFWKMIKRVTHTPRQMKKQGIL